MIKTQKKVKSIENEEIIMAMTMTKTIITKIIIIIMMRMRIKIHINSYLLKREKRSENHVLLERENHIM